MGFISIKYQLIFINDLFRWTMILLFQVLVIGATNSGKTSLIEKYLTGSNSCARTTLCLDINKARMPFEFMGQTYNLTFYIYDMAGMKKFQSHNSSYYADVFAVLFVFDITCRISLNFTINWLGDYCNFCQKEQFSPAEKILVCNKVAFAFIHLLMYSDQ